MNNKLITILLCAIISLSVIGCSSKNNDIVSNDDVINTTIDNETETEDDTYIENSLSNQPSFSTVDLDGNQIDDSIFADYDLTIVNYWAVYCPYCIEEMPDLNNWNKELSNQNIQVLGVVSDQNHDENNERIVMSVDETITEATKIIEENNVNYTNIVTNDDIRDFFDIEITSFPTTFFVDNKGNIIDNSIMNYSGVNNFKERLNMYLTDGKLDPIVTDSDDNDEPTTYYEIGEKITLDNGEKIVVVVDDEGYLFGILDSESTWYYAYVGTDMSSDEKEEFDKKLAEITRPLPRR